ncbi:copper homeostasis protein CutC [Pseudonocardia sp. CA-107938]|uniref:copper homeostasis protein CutC n=1 Tax=Pseudonocardia sp. CA-107938 TaxID=3240021 RepID=UPI003D92C4CA
MVQLEISVETLDGVGVASIADRIELCAGLSEGGLTPSIALVEAAVFAAGTAQVHVLVRPRPGGFAYCPDELALMRADIRHAVAAGAAGIVVGALDGDEVDIAATAGLVDAARGVPVTFHRAFDRLAEPLPALDALAELGVERVLTSGGPATVDVDAVAALVAHGSLTIMACGGIRPHNVRAVLDRTGVTAVHAAPRIPVGTASTYPGTGVPEGHDRFATDADAVGELRELTR